MSANHELCRLICWRRRLVGCKKRPRLIPARFIAVCKEGHEKIFPFSIHCEHIFDFPFHSVGLDHDCFFQIIRFHYGNNEIGSMILGTNFRILVSPFSLFSCYNMRYQGHWKKENLEGGSEGKGWYICLHSSIFSAG